MVPHLFSSTRFAVGTIQGDSGMTKHALLAVALTAILAGSTGCGGWHYGWGNCGDGYCGYGGGCGSHCGPACTTCESDECCDSDCGTCCPCECGLLRACWNGCRRLFWCPHSVGPYDC